MSNSKNLDESASKKNEKGGRKDRLSNALKSNLHRRKEQKRKKEDAENLISLENQKSKIKT